MADPFDTLLCVLLYSCALQTLFTRCGEIACFGECLISDPTGVDALLVVVPLDISPPDKSLYESVSYVDVVSAFDTKSTGKASSSSSSSASSFFTSTSTCLASGPIKLALVGFFLGLLYILYSYPY